MLYMCVTTGDPINELLNPRSRACFCTGGGAPAPEQSVPMRLAAGLRYGENPHQPAAAYLDASLAEAGRGGIATAIQHHGKEVRGYPRMCSDSRRVWNVVDARTPCISCRQAKLQC